jgi:hypothetical protein
LMSDAITRIVPSGEDVVEAIDMCRKDIDLRHAKDARSSVACHRRATRHTYASFKTPRDA